MERDVADDECEALTGSLDTLPRSKQGGAHITVWLTGGSCASAQSSLGVGEIGSKRLLRVQLE